MRAIEISDLTKYYGKTRGVENLNLTVEEGEFFGFIGPNGAGKSTTIRTLLGLISPTGGQALVFGQKLSPRQNLAEIGYMPSETFFYSGMSVRDILRFSADLRKKDCREEAARLCDRLELEPNKKVNELSLGNRKKVSIVCALQHRPKLCILDEPTSGLDPLMQREFYAILEERNAQGTTVFLSSHVLSEVQRHCKRAAVIRAGRLLACDSTKSLGHGDAKRVTVRGLENPPALENIRDVKRSGDTLSFLYSGTPQALLQALAGQPITDLEIAQPDLEEIFLHYYEREEA